MSHDTSDRKTPFDSLTKVLYQFIDAVALRRATWDRRDFGPKAALFGFMHNDLDLHYRSPLAEPGAGGRLIQVLAHVDVMALAGLFLARATAMDMALEDIADARLISGACALEPPQHVRIQSQRNKLLGIFGFRTPAPHQLAAAMVIRGCEPLRSQFRNLVVFMRLHDMAIKLLPQYEADEGPLTAGQTRQIKKRAPQGKKRSVRSSLFEVEPR